MSKGHYPATLPNPAEVTKAATAKTRRARLTPDLFLKIMVWAETNQESWAVQAYKLALLTGQSRNEIHSARFRDIKTVDGVEYLHIVRQKTGAAIRIPTGLKLEA